MAKNDDPELFIQTVKERQQEEKAQQANALLKLAMMAREDANSGRVACKNDVLKRLRSARS